MKHITIKDIARHLSLSVSTVSRALINDKNIRQETKERVLETAKMLGYKPNPVAQFEIWTYEYCWDYRSGNAHSVCFTSDKRYTKCTLC